MKPDDFIQLLARFSGQPIPATLNRHVYVWVGSSDDLLAKSPPGLFKLLDLHQLCQQIEKAPFGDKAAARILTDAIEVWLQREFLPIQHQRALCVAGLGLLYRYHLPLGIFMKLASENSLVVLAISSLDIEFRPSKTLPATIQFSPDAILKYITIELPSEAIVRQG